MGWILVFSMVNVLSLNAIFNNWHLALFTIKLKFSYSNSNLIKWGSFGTSSTYKRISIELGGKSGQTPSTILQDSTLQPDWSLKGKFLHIYNQTWNLTFWIISIGFLFCNYFEISFMRPTTSNILLFSKIYMIHELIGIQDKNRDLKSMSVSASYILKYLHFKGVGLAIF